MKLVKLYTTKRNRTIWVDNTSNLRLLGALNDMFKYDIDTESLYAQNLNKVREFWETGNNIIGKIVLN